MDGGWQSINAVKGNPNMLYGVSGKPNIVKDVRKPCKFYNIAKFKEPLIFI